MRRDPEAEFPPPPPLNPDAQPPIDRYCDVVMKGGVVDGVVYPWAIMALAHQYRFKNIGGTSVGALAAALTAAAEYSRRYGSVRGFNEVMLKVPLKLAEDAPVQAGQHPRSGKKDTKLFSLFQPAPHAQRLFDLFVSLCSAPTSHSKWARLQAALAVLLSAYVGWAWLGATVGMVCTLALGWLMAVPLEPFPLWVLLALGVVFALVGSAVFIALGVWRDVKIGLLPGGVGLCTGKQTSPQPGVPQGLIDWLHEGIQGAAGRTSSHILTFKDLWDAPGGPTSPAPLSPAALPNTQRPRSIDLRMVTSNLTQGRPYGLPLSGTSNRLFFKASELSAFFPDDVMRHLKAKAKRYAPQPVGTVQGDEYCELPQGDLPIIVATRMSLSFPVLFKPVPLWALKAQSQPGENPFYKCWFSDGGLCANFPIHQFDAVLPRWPTFGIMLDKGRRGQAVWMTGAHDDGLQEFDEPSVAPLQPTPLNTLLGFFSDILGTVRSWNDSTSVRQPGVRDRVVHIGLERERAPESNAGESVLGGLDLKISGAVILRMAGLYGRPAGEKLVDKFLGPQATGAVESPGWREHRWVRFNSFVAALRTRMGGFTEAAQFAPYTDQLSAHITESMTASPLTGTQANRVLSPVQAQALHQVQEALTALERSLAQANPVQPYQPDPRSELHLRSPM